MSPSQALAPDKKPAINARSLRVIGWVCVIIITALAVIIVAWQARQTKAGLLPHSSVVDQRQLDPERFLKALEGRPKAPVEIVVLANDSEALQLALQFQSLLQIAGWKVSHIREVEQRDLARLANRPAYTNEEDQLVGIAVAVAAESQEEFDIFGDREADTPLNALLEAVLETLGSANIYAASNKVFPAPPPKTLRMAIGSRPESGTLSH
jgi:hypothetical protein